MIYRIYRRGFQDANGDGVDGRGPLAGPIESQMPHLPEYGTLFASGDLKGAAVPSVQSLA